MSALMTPEALWSIFVIFFLEMILGFDNMLYITIETNRVPIHAQKKLRFWSFFGAAALRVFSLWLVVSLLASFSAPLFTVNVADDPDTIILPVSWISGSFMLSALIFIFGGFFLMYTAVKEISHMLVFEDLENETHSSHVSVKRALVMIWLMNIVFSFDSVLTALAISDHFLIQAIGIILSSIVMIVLAEPFAAFMKKNRMYEVLGLFILMIVAVSLIGEGGHQGDLVLFGQAVEPLAKSTFYFSIFLLVLVELVQTRYNRKIQAEIDRN